MGKIIRTLEELEDEVARFVASLAPRELGATLITLSGELGAGKTAFTKAIAKAFGIEDIVNSPTFVLEKIYLIQSEFGGLTPKFERLVHIDAYRLDKGENLAHLGFDELMHDANNIIMLEWPEKISALPSPTINISFIVNADGSRTITYG